jgi:hypothetical protein
MTFKGFSTKVPEYEVITPQTKLSFTVRSLTVREEEHMKGSLMTPMKITEHLDKCIWDSLVQKPESIPDYNTFLRKLTLKDRDALLYGLYHITYEEIRNYEIRCKKCKNNYPVTIKASSTFSINVYPVDDNVVEKRVPVPLPLTKGVTVIIKQPTMFDELTAYRELAQRPGTKLDIIAEALIIESFEMPDEETGEPTTLNDKVDILDAYMSLPARDKRVLYEKYMEHFGNYKIELQMKTYCPQCVEEDTVDIDLVDNFFRSMYTS